MAVSPGRRTTSAIALDELRKRDDLESLRKFLISEQCFPAHKEPEIAPISMEELKKLARIWKLNERRNFWKNHSERNEMVAALLQHAEQDQKYLTKKMKVHDASSAAATSGSAAAAVSEYKAVPPTDAKPSMTRKNLDIALKLRNYCGIKYFNRVPESEELLLQSRFFDFPDAESNIDHVVDSWRSEDFFLKDESALLDGAGSDSYDGSNGGEMDNTAAGRSQSARQSTAATGSGGKHSVVSGIKNKVKLVKHRNLATHLMNYSASTQLQLQSLTLKTVQTFINVAETDDNKTVSNCMIAISNIASSEHVRSLLFEINALHKVTNMLQHVRGKAALRAAGLLFYYFSCDADSEDRVYNSCSTFLQANGLAKDQETRLLSLYTLNNLMPCIDRQRVADITLRIIHANFDAATTLQDRLVLSVYLAVMLNMCCYTNAHATLLGLDILSLLAIIAKFAVKEQNEEVAMSVSKILHSFLQAPEQASSLLSSSYVEVLLVLLQGMHHESVLTYCLRVATVLSSIHALKPLLHEQTRAVLTISNMIIERSSSPQPPSAATTTTTTTGAMAVSNALAKEAARFFVNMSSGEDSAHLEMLVENRMAAAILRLLDDQSIAAAAKNVAVAALQNLLSAPRNASQLAQSFFQPLLLCLQRSADISAALSLYNISCAAQCRSQLVESGIHLQLLQFLITSKQMHMKSAFLQTLVQMSSSNVCVLQLLEVELVRKLEAQLQGQSSREVWGDISLLLLAVVAFAADDVSTEDQISIVRILQVICVSGSKPDVIENCANVLKYISVRFSEFSELDPVVRSILHLSDREEVVESVSNVLYNMSCSRDNITSMLRDHEYVNLMIHIMRSGKLQVQENIAQALRNLCTNSRCTEILLKHDILSDMIVIALLRTSSEEIKVVCSEAFYNMLCHSQTRLQLLKGDLWWAIMRLCRTDSHDVRSNCGKALFDLSTDAVNIAPLRQHHVLSFVRDIISSGNDSFLRICLRSVHNLIRQFADAEYGFFDIVGHEVVSAIRIATAVLPRIQSQPSGTAVSVDATDVAADSNTMSSSSHSNNSSSSSDACEYARACISLLLKCAQQSEIEEMAPEFVRQYIAEVLDNTKQQWGRDRSCRIYVSRLLWELCQKEAFTKACHLSDLDAVCCTCYLQNPPFEVLDNIAAVLLQVVVTEKIAPEVLIAMKLWRVVLMEALSTESMVLQQHKKSMAAFAADKSPHHSSSATTNAASNAGAGGRRHRGTELAVRPAQISPLLRGASGTFKSTPPLSTTTTATTTAAAAVINATDDDEDDDDTDAAAVDMDGFNTATAEKSRSKLRERGVTTMGAEISDALSRALELRIQDTRSAVLSLLSHSIRSIIASQPEIITRSLVMGICSREFIDHSQSRNNLLLVLSALSEVPSFAGFLLDAHVFRLLARYVANTIGTSKLERAQEFCAAFLHNVSLHVSLLPRVVSTADGSLNELIRELLEGQRSLTVQLYLAVFFFHAASFLVKNEQSLNPKFVLDHIGKMTNIDSDNNNNNNNNNNEEGSSSNGTAADLSAINKYTISMVLNKYSFGAGVDPNYVQYMFTYITQQNQHSTVPRYIESDCFRRLDNLHSAFHIEVLKRKGSEEVELEVFRADGMLWSPTGSSQPQRHESIILKSCEAAPLLHDPNSSSSNSSGNEVSPSSSSSNSNSGSGSGGVTTFFVFSKIVKEFSALKERLDGGENAAITEAAEEEDDDDDDDTGAEEEQQKKLEVMSAYSQSTGNSASDNSNNNNGQTSATDAVTETAAAVVAVAEGVAALSIDPATAATAVEVDNAASLKSSHSSHSHNSSHNNDNSSSSKRQQSPVPLSRKSPLPSSSHKSTAAAAAVAASVEIK